MNRISATAVLWGLLLMTVLQVDGIRAEEKTAPDGAALQAKLVCPVTAEGDLLMRKGTPFLVKGISYNPYYPGESVSDYARRVNYPEDMRQIREAHINTLMLYRIGHPDLYAHALEAGLYFLQGIGIRNDAEDYQDPEFKAQVKRSIQWHVDQINRDLTRQGASFEKRIAERIIAYWLGGEFTPASIAQTDKAHPEITAYEGRFISAPPGSGATACFLAEVADYLMTYEYDTYGFLHYVSHVNWPVTQKELPLKFLPVAMFDVYPYWPSEVTDAAPGSYSRTRYQGYLEWLAREYEGMPLLISEFGFSTAPESPTGVHSTEEEQGIRLMQCWCDILTADRPIAGGSVFEWNDEWWKQSSEAFVQSRSYDMTHHEKDDIEEWFGIISIDGPSSFQFTVRPKPAYWRVKEMYSETFDPRAWLAEQAKKAAEEEQQP